MDVVNLAQNGIQAASNAQNTADTALVKQIGSTNILRGTNNNIKIVDTGVSNWSDGTWDGTQGSSARKSIVDISGSPNPSITKGFRITLNTDNSPSFIQQANVDVASGNVYTISCYAKGGASEIKLGYRYPNSSVSGKDVKSSLTSNWKRYYFTFQIPNGITKVNVLFGINGYRGLDGYICGMKLERGNTASDWTESERDTYVRSTVSSADYTDATASELKTYTKNYTDTISKNDREFTQSQRQALDESFTQYKVLQRLTNNFRNKGLYLKNNELYINASYIMTGTLDAGIVKAGILTDKKERNKWNMATGYLYTDKMEAENMRASGRFECGSSYKLVMENGEIDGYQNSTWVGSIDPTANLINLDTGETLKGLQIRGNGIVDIRSRYLAIRNRNDHGTSTFGTTDTVSFSVIESISKTGNGGISWQPASHGIRVINGIVTSVW